MTQIVNFISNKYVDDLIICEARSKFKDIAASGSSSSLFPSQQANELSVWPLLDQVEDEGDRGYYSSFAP